MGYYKCVKLLTVLAAATVPFVPFCDTSPFSQEENLQRENTSQRIVSVLPGPGEFHNINNFNRKLKYPHTDTDPTVTVTVKQDKNYRAMEWPQFNLHRSNSKGMVDGGSKYRARRSATGTMAMAAMAAKGGGWIKKFVVKTVITQVAKNVVKSALKRGGNKRNMGNGRGMRGMRGGMQSMGMGWSR